MLLVNALDMVIVILMTRYVPVDYSNNEQLRTIKMPVNCSTTCHLSSEKLFVRHFAYIAYGISWNFAMLYSHTYIYYHIQYITIRRENLPERVFQHFNPLSLSFDWLMWKTSICQMFDTDKFSKNTHIILYTSTNNPKVAVMPDETCGSLIVNCI